MMINSRDKALIYMSAALPRFAQSRDDHQIFAGLADRMGVGAAFTQGRDSGEWLQWLWDGCQDVAGAAGATHDWVLPAMNAGRTAIAESSLGKKAMRTAAMKGGNCIRHSRWSPIAK